MKTWVRLLAMFATCVVLFAGTWYLLKQSDQKQAVAPTPKTASELLIGKWQVIDPQPPLSSDVIYIYEYTTDGRQLLWVTTPDGVNHGPMISFYQLLDPHVLRIDTPEMIGRPHRTFFLSLEALTEEMLIIVVKGDPGDGNRAVLSRIK